MKIATHRMRTLLKGKSGQKEPKVNLKNERTTSFDTFISRVEEKAYELYEKRGRQDGQDWNDWFEAEKIVEEEMIGEK